MDRWLVLYDGECNLCKLLLAGFLLWDRRHRLQPLALQTEAAQRQLADMTPEQQMSSWHLISPTGHRHDAGAALAPMLRTLPGGHLPAVALEHAPRATEHAYAYIAQHRGQLSRHIPEPLKRRAGAYVEHRERLP